MYIFSGSRCDWYEYTTDWEKEINKKKTNYLCLYYEEMNKVSCSCRNVLNIENKYITQRFVNQTIGRVFCVIRPLNNSLINKPQSTCNFQCIYNCELRLACFVHILLV